MSDAQCTSSAPRRHHSSVNVVTIAEDLRTRAASLLREDVFPSGHKIVERVPGLYRERLSRACSGCTSNPLFVLAGWVFALFMAGAPRERAQLLVDWLQDVVDALYSAAPRSAIELSPEEQRIEGQETSYQVAYGAGDKSVRRDWIAHLRAERAVSAELIRALEAEALAEQLGIARAA